jgi:hypothetical protein
VLLIGIVVWRENLEGSNLSEHFHPGHIRESQNSFGQDDPASKEGISGKIIERCDLLGPLVV